MSKKKRNNKKKKVDLKQAELKKETTRQKQVKKEVVKQDLCKTGVATEVPIKPEVIEESLLASDKKLAKVGSERILGKVYSSIVGKIDMKLRVFLITVASLLLSLGSGAMYVSGLGDIFISKKDLSAQVAILATELNGSLKSFDILENENIYLKNEIKEMKFDMRELKDENKELRIQNASYREDLHGNEIKMLEMEVKIRDLENADENYCVIDYELMS